MNKGKHKLIIIKNMQTWRQDNGTVRMQEVAKVVDFEYLGEMAIFGGLVGYVVLFIICPN